MPGPLGRRLQHLDPIEHRVQRREIVAEAVAEHDEVSPPPTGKRKQANFDRAGAMFDSVKMGESEWLAALDADPQIMWSILGDIAKVWSATQGPTKTGRRPGVSMSLRDLERIITPQYAMEPFAEAIQPLLKGKSLRAFAARVPCHHTTLTRLISGELQLTRPLLEQIAAAGRMPASYFREYRTMYVAEMIAEVFDARPELGVTTLKRVRAVAERNAR